MSIPQHQLHKRPGFTFIEILLIVAIAIIMLSMVFNAIIRLIEESRYARAKIELTEIAQGTQMYIHDNGNWPDDVNRDIPPGVEEYITPREWPDAPWPNSVYDWDVKDVGGGVKFYQISIRFCPLGEPENCDFPEQDWAEDFDYYSSVYLCMHGPCRAHPSKPIDHPGYCVNCQDEEG